VELGCRVNTIESVSEHNLLVEAARQWRPEAVWRQHFHRPCPTCGRDSRYKQWPIDCAYVALAIRNFHDSGDTTGVRSALAILTALFDRLGRYEPATTIAGFAASPLTSTAMPEFNSAIAHLSEVLGDPTYESLAHKGETMTTAEMVTHVFDQIDQARTELEHPS